MLAAGAMMHSQTPLVRAIIYKSMDRVHYVLNPQLANVFSLVMKWQ